MRPRRLRAVLIVLAVILATWLAWPSQPADAHHKTGHGTTTTTVAPTTTTVAPTTTTTAPPACSPGTPITITTGGTYSGCYRSTTATPAVTISTTQPVIFDHARIEHTGIGMQDADAQGTREHVTIRDTTFQQLPTALVISHRAVWIENPASFTSEWSRYIDGDGVIVYGIAPSGAVTDAPLLFRNNYGTDVGKYPPYEPERSGVLGNCCVQMLQLAWFRSASIEIAWNKSVNAPGQSDGEDLINLYQSGGSDSAHRAQIHHNLVDGSFNHSLTGNDTGTGINIGDAWDAHSVAHHNVAVNVTNGGFGVSETDNWATDNLVVSDGAPQVGEVDGQAFIIYVNVNPPGPRATNNRINFVREPGGAQMPCWMAEYCANNTIVSTTEDQARAEWEDTRTAAGQTVGPRP